MLEFWTNWILGSFLDFLPCYYGETDLMFRTIHGTPSHFPVNNHKTAYNMSMTNIIINIYFLKKLFYGLFDTFPIEF